MNREAIVTAVAEKTGYTKTQVRITINAFIEVLTQALANKKSVMLQDFGSFSIIKKKNRKGTNPTTHESIEIQGSYGVKFKVGKFLKEKVNKDVK